MLLTNLADIFGVLTLSIILSASIILHRWVRATSTLALLVSSLLLFAYRLVVPFPLFLYEHFVLSTPVWLHHVLVQSTLQLFVAASFLYVVLSALRPNNSFKPTPLRGAA